MTTKFPDTFDYAGFNAPMRTECDIYDLVIEGNLPAEINGTWYRTIPDPQYPPMLGHDTYLSGDGMISAFKFENGHIDFKMKYIMTDRLKADRKARRGLFGLYRNPYTDDPSVKGVNRCVNNTTPIFHGGKLLTLKEDGHAVEVHPETLETIGVFNYRGKLKSQTMTAHTRLDNETQDLHFFGYEASGLATRDVSYCVADKEGQLVKEEWFQVPYVSLMHDFAVSKEHVIFPVFPTTGRSRSHEGRRHALGFRAGKGRVRGHHADRRPHERHALVPSPRVLGVSFHERVHGRQIRAFGFRHRQIRAVPVHSRGVTHPSESRGFRIRPSGALDIRHVQARRKIRRVQTRALRRFPAHRE